MKFLFIIVINNMDTFVALYNLETISLIALSKCCQTLFFKVRTTGLKISLDLMRHLTLNVAVEFRAANQQYWDLMREQSGKK